jgi:hypothetical protein
MKEPRSCPNAFLVNDNIYVMPRRSNLSGEKYHLKENRWKEFMAKSQGKANFMVH